MDNQQQEIRSKFNTIEVNLLKTQPHLLTQLNDPDYDVAKLVFDTPLYLLEFASRDVVSHEEITEIFLDGIILCGGHPNFVPSVSSFIRLENREAIDLIVNRAFALVNTIRLFASSWISALRSSNNADFIGQLGICAGDAWIHLPYSIRNILKNYGNLFPYMKSNNWDLSNVSTWDNNIKDPSAIPAMVRMSGFIIVKSWQALQSISKVTTQLKIFQASRFMDSSLFAPNAREHFSVTGWIKSLGNFGVSESNIYTPITYQRFNKIYNIPLDFAKRDYILQVNNKDDEDHIVNIFDSIRITDDGNHSPSRSSSSPSLSPSKFASKDFGEKVAKYFDRIARGEMSTIEITNDDVYDPMFCANEFFNALISLDYEVIATELPIRTLVRPGTVINGRLDCVAVNKYGGVAILDFKTTLKYQSDQVLIADIVQLMTYAVIFAEMTNIVPSELCIAKLSCSQGRISFIKIPFSAALLDKFLSLSENSSSPYTAMATSDTFVSPLTKSALEIATATGFDMEKASLTQAEFERAQRDIFTTKSEIQEKALRSIDELMKLTDVYTEDNRVENLQEFVRFLLIHTANNANEPFALPGKLSDVFSVVIFLKLSLGSISYLPPDERFPHGALDMSKSNAITNSTLR